jgi:hypothetical protein
MLHRGICGRSIMFRRLMLAIAEQFGLPLVL